MKKLYIGIATVLVFGIGFFLIKTCMFSSSPHQLKANGKVSEKSILGAVTNFYTAYQECLKNPPKEANGNVSEYCQAHTGLTSQNFVSNLRLGGISEAGADPILCAQNTPQKVVAQSVNEQTPTSARVTVQLKFGDTMQDNKVDIIVEDGAWKVDNVVCPGS